MNFQQILNRLEIDAHCCPNIRVGPKVVDRPELPALPLPPVNRAFTGGQGVGAMASMDAGILGLAREALSKRLEDYQLEAVLGKGASAASTAPRTYLLAALARRSRSSRFRARRLRERTGSWCSQRRISFPT